MIDWRQQAAEWRQAARDWLEKIAAADPCEMAAELIRLHRNLAQARRGMWCAFMVGLAMGLLISALRQWAR